MLQREWFTDGENQRKSGPIRQLSNQTTFGPSAPFLREFFGDLPGCAHRVA